MSQALTKSHSTRAKLVAGARLCVGTPWRHQGRVPGQHLDCVGLVRYAGIFAGVIDRSVDFTAYGRMAQPALMREKLLENFKITTGRWGGALPGTVLWLKIEDEPMHLAVWTGAGIIHAVSGGPARVVEHGFRPPWPKRLYAVLEWRSITDE